MAFGRYPVSWLLSSAKAKTRNPKWEGSAENRYIKCPGGNVIYVEMFGPEAAQPLVLVHGLNSSREQWSYQCDFFKKRFRVIVIDLPGHGNSTQPADLGIGAIASNLQFVLEQLAVKNPIIYGHSMGAMTTMEYCIKRVVPNVKGIILQHCTHTNALKTIQFSYLIRMLQEPVLKPFLNFAKGHPALLKAVGLVNYLSGASLIFYRYLFYTGQQTAAQLRYTSRIAALCPPEVTAEGILKCMEFEVSRALGKINVPCLVIAGNSDRVTKPSAARYISKRIKTSKLVTVEGGHLSLVEYPDDVNSLVDNFIGRLG